MGGSATRVGIRKGGMPGEAFPTLGHPPRCILMGGEHPEKPSDGYFPQLWHQGPSLITPR